MEFRGQSPTTFGLAAGIWSENIKIAHHVASKLKAGTFWVNDYGLEMEGAPFGGYKKSGTGRELGSYALDEYTEVKSVYVNVDKKVIINIGVGALKVNAPFLSLKFALERVCEVRVKGFLERVT